jgi:excisionase family DNA binding protein
MPLRNSLKPLDRIVDAGQGKRGLMEKICIVKRRKPTEVSPLHQECAPIAASASPLLRVELTSQQTEAIRSNGYFRHLYPDKGAPIFLNLHFNDGHLPKMLRPREICDILQVSRNTVDKLVRTGRIKSVRVGRLIRFSAEDVWDYLAGGCPETGKLRSLSVDVANQRTVENPLD